MTKEDPPSYGLHSNEKQTGSPLWQKAVERYRAELDENDDYQAVIEVSTLDALLDHIKSIQTSLPPERSILNSMTHLGPRLKFIDDFSAIMALYFGADPNLTGLIWGSIRLMLTLASSAGDTLQDIVDMLEELSLTLPRFKAYETNLPMSPNLETALLDVYTEIICFYARAIHFFRTYPHALLRRKAWEGFRKDFGHTLPRIKRLTSTIESEADFARMKLDNLKYEEVLNVIEGLEDTKIQDQKAVRFQYIPLEMNPRFWGREEVIEAVKDVLQPQTKTKTLKSFALFGMGGIGKTQIALQYARRNYDAFDAILWIAADNSLTAAQSFRDIARGLNLVEKDDELQDPVKALLRVKAWLTETDSSWLLIFDNADDLEVLRTMWPGNACGSVLITTRDFNAVYSPASAGRLIQPFDNSIGSKVLLDLAGLDPMQQNNQNAASEISQTLGGLPLAISQIAGFIAQRRLPLRDFLPLYERNSAKIDSRKVGLGDYEHTISTVWEVSLKSMARDPHNLLGVLAFFEPDAVHEQILLEGSRDINDNAFQFLCDEMDLGDAEQILLQSALIEKARDNPILSMHRLVQAAVIRRLSELERGKYVDVVVRILTWGFPDTWSQDIGHQFGFWNKCEKCLRHVSNLVKQVSRHKIKPNDSKLYAELLLRCSWYLYEREQYSLAKVMIDAALSTFPDHTTLAYASAVDLSGLIDLDMNHSSQALAAFTQALQIRQSILGSDDPLIASSLNNIALAHTEMNSLDKAFETHHQAIDIRLRTASDRIGNSYSNLASLLLRMNDPDTAEATLKKCPSLQNFTDETFLATGNPRFSGDMVLLSRIRLAQGKPDDALRLASKALAFRQKMLGNRVKTCDSLYDVASLLAAQGNVAAAIELLHNLVSISEALGEEGEGQLARGCWKLSVLYREKDPDLKNDPWRAQALSIKTKLKPDSDRDAFDENSFSELCLWMLW